MAKYFNFLLLVIFLFNTIFAGEYHQNYVHYHIDVTLNDAKHYLSGKETIVYYNNYPDTLNRIYLLLYPNAYRDNTTHFARQQKKYGKTKYLNAEHYQRGFISIDSLTVNRIESDILIPEDSITTGYIQLDEPLLPQDSVVIYSEWQVKIPESFSRMCHSGQKYYISQWFPKIPVYDHDGWHPYPYLSIGEFYYEFADYDVSITLPENYVVAATGELISPHSEHRFLDSLAAVGKEVMDMSDEEWQSWLSFHENPPSAGNTKTLTYSAKNVVDFAWTASKEHLVQKSYFNHENDDDPIVVWNYFLPENRESWRYAIAASEGTLRSYGKLCGPYPYPNVITVDGDMTAGGGMEYPMLTIINASKIQLAMWRVIGHEIGHNWFYGILGFNERLQPWMDEGLNTYGELRFMTEEFPDSLSILNKVPFIERRLENINTQNVYNLFLNTASYLKMTEPGDLNSSLYKNRGNYFVSTYNRPAMGFHLMEQYAGEENFVAAMNNFYEEWKFKHPQPEDMQISFENSLGKDLDWFFDEYIQTTGVADYCLTDFYVEAEQDNYRSIVSVTNKGDASPPFSISLLKNKKVIAREWVVPEDPTTTHDIITQEKPDDVVINKNNYTQETNYYNNNTKLLPPLDLNLIFEIPRPDRYLVNYLPYLNYNYNEGLKLGGGFYHLSATPPKNTWLAYGSYGTKSRELNGTFWYSTRFVGDRVAPNFSVHLSHDALLNKGGATVSVDYLDQRQAKAGIQFGIDLLNIKNLEYLDHDFWTPGDFLSVKLNNSASIKKQNLSVKNNFELKIINDQTNTFYKLTLDMTARQDFDFFEFSNRIFLGSFIGESKGLPRQFRFFAGGGIDPEFDQFYVYDRSGETALTPIRNYLISEGVNLKGYQGLADEKEIPGGDAWSFGYNAKIKKGPGFLFFDAGNVLSHGEEYSLRWDAGVGLDLFLFDFYFPLYVSDPFDGYDQISSWKAIKKRWMVMLTLPDILIFE
ncbi:MAG: M1 family aminopeptidase [Fidelibacterota bacterium]